MLQICKELVKKSRQQSAYLSLEQTYLLLGDLNKALDCLANSLEIARETQDIFGEGIALGDIGCVYFKLQDFVKALRFFTSQLHIAKKLGLRDREGTAYGNQGMAYQMLGNFQKSIECHELSINIAKELEHRTKWRGNWI